MMIDWIENDDGMPPGTKFMTVSKIRGDVRRLQILHPKPLTPQNKTYLATY